MFNYKDLDSHDDIVHDLGLLGTTDEPTDAIIGSIERLICKLYLPFANLTSLSDARWYLFKKKQAQTENLPPTKAALLPAIRRAHYQSMIWCNDIFPRQSYQMLRNMDGTLKMANMNQ